MTFLDLAAARYSVRRFDPRPVEQAKLDAVLEAARLAPTAVNYQPQRIYRIRSAALRQALQAHCPMKFVFRAPELFVLGYDADVAWKNELAGGAGSGETDAAIACTHMMLAAHEQGLGSCWIGYFDPEAVRGALGLPENIRITALLPLGYPAENSAPAALHAASRPIEEMFETL